MTQTQATTLVTEILMALAEARGALPSGHLFARLNVQSLHDYETVLLVAEQCFPAGALIRRSGNVVAITEAGARLMLGE